MIRKKVKPLQTKLTAEDWTKLNMRAKYAATTNQGLSKDLQDAQEAGGRSERRAAICGWVLDPSRGNCYTALRTGVSQDLSWKNRALAGHERLCALQVVRA